MTESGNDLQPILARSLAAAGGDAWARVHTLRLEGTVRAGGLAGPCTQWVDMQRGRFAMSLQLGPAALSLGHDGEVAWQRGANGEVVVQDSEAGRRTAATDAWIHARGWWFPQRLPATVASRGRHEAYGVAYDVLRFEPAGGQWVALWFDEASHLPVRIEQEVLGKPSLRRLDDWRDVGGLMLPFRVASGNGDPRFDRVTEFATIALDEVPPTGAFEVPPQCFDDVLFADAGSQARIPIAIVNNHVFVDVALDGHPMRFMLDTGGVNLVERGAAARIGLASVGALEVRGPGEKSVASGFARVARLDIGGAVTLRNQLLRVLDMPGLDEVEGVAVDGVLGVELFKRVAVQIDYAGRTLTLSHSAVFTPPAGAHTLALQFFGHFAAVEGDIDGIAGQFWLDTGNRGGLLLQAPFVETNGLAERYASSALTTIGWGIGGRAQGRLARAGCLSLGGLRVDGPVLRLPEDRGGALSIRHVAGNIGGEIRGRFVVAFDYARRQVHLLPDADAGKPFGADRSGLWVNRHARGAVVGSVMSGGPADDGGLRVGDVIADIDGIAVLTTGLGRLRERLAEPSRNRLVALTVQRDGDERQVTLVLRDLIPAQRAL